VREQDTGRKVAGRVLGDEWEDWDGNVESHDGEIHATARPFALMLSLVLIIYWGIALLACYLVLPRLRGFHPYLGVAGVAVAAAFILLSSLWLFTLGLSMAFGRSVLVGTLSRRLVLHFMNPFLMWFARILGFSRDRIGHSFIRLNNALARGAAGKTEKTIVLLPRCLRRDVRKEVLEIAGRFDVPTYTVVGGEEAREAISREEPDAIVAVACERDLAGGIRDVSPVIVVGIPNVRREGPCRNTEVDTEAFERALELFKGAGK
jgi:hypothetical protein